MYYITHHYDPFIDATKTYFSSCHTKAKLINSGKYSNKCEKQRRINRITRVSSSYHLINTIVICIIVNDINNVSVNTYEFLLLFQTLFFNRSYNEDLLNIGCYGNYYHGDFQSYPLENIQC